MRRALITGIGGQDGSYLAEILLEAGYEVHGLYRRTSTGNLRRVEHIKDKLTLHMGDLLDYSSVERIIKQVKPDEIYNEADQDDVRCSDHSPLYNYQVTFAAVGALLEIIRRYSPESKVFQPVSATMFGRTPPPQNEESPLDPMSPYAVAKAGAYHLCRMYRKRYGLFVSCGIMFNHDSARRSEEYLVHRICKAALRIAEGKQDKMVLYNLDQLVDVGHAKDFMIGACRLMRQDKPHDMVLATGAGQSVGDIASAALSCVGAYQHQLVGTTGPRSTETLVGDITKAKSLINFDPRDGQSTVIDICRELRVT